MDRLNLDLVNLNGANSNSKRVIWQFLVKQTTTLWGLRVVCGSTGIKTLDFGFILYSLDTTCNDHHRHVWTLATKSVYKHYINSRLLLSNF